MGINENIISFKEGMGSYNNIKKDIEELMRKEDIDYYGENVNDCDIDYHIYSDRVELIIGFNTGALPFSAIKVCNDYFGFPCTRIGASVGHNIYLIYTINSNNNNNDDDEELIELNFRFDSLLTFLNGGEYYQFKNDFYQFLDKYENNICESNIMEGDIL